MIRGAQRVRQQIARGPVRGPEWNLWYWHPNRAGVRSGPAWFMRKLEEVDPDLTLTWSPLAQEWILWARTPRVVTRYGNGWNLLFTIDPTMLDERQFARLYSCSMKRWGSAKRYFDHIEAQAIREREAAERQSRSSAIDQATEVWEHSQIRVGYGANNGSKFSTYHS